MSRHDDLITNLGSMPIFCSNLGFGEQGAILSKIKKGIYVCPNIEQAKNMERQLNALNINCVVIDEFNKHFTPSLYQSNQNKIELIKALEMMVFSSGIIITTPNIFFTFIPNLEKFKQEFLTIDKNTEYDIYEIEKKLIKIGYHKVDAVSSAGEFARRGDILDVFSFTENNPFRVDFFDTTIESINSFDYLTFDKISNLSSIRISPKNLSCFSLDEKEKLITNFKNLSLQNELFFNLISSLENNEDVPLEFCYPFVDVETFISSEYPIIISNSIIFETSYEKIFTEFNNRINLLKNENIEKIYKNNKKILKIDDFFDKFANKLIFFDNLNLNNTNLRIKFNTKNVLNLDFKSVDFDSFLYHLDKLKIQLNPYKNKQIYLCLSSQETLLSIKKIFTETNVPFSENMNSKGIILTTLKIPYNICFSDEEKFYIGSTNFAHKKEIKTEKKQSIKYLPKAGEYVVHSIHGIGKCEGTVIINSSGVDKEFFKITYRGGDCLYVPYENADCLSLYLSNGITAKLNKLGGKEFQTQKLKAQQSIEEMSEQLLTLYAKRKSAKGFKYPENDYLFTEFENAFEHNETADQLHAINDILNDMTSGKVMDRLICGDVGFGKTEVAMRALFKTVMAGKQVAILAPTTILSLQHCQTATNRTKDFGINVQMLNRFVDSAHQKEILRDLKSGKVNVVCGTHRLLSKDVQFNDLGLLILDEEQRFGVKAKEHIKELKNNVNVLTLSATPIPRTLSMSLMAIRDISIINTPPTNRLPVKTYVMCYNEEIVLQAINDEIERGGQVLVVYNNIEHIHEVCNNLRTKLNNPNAIFDVAHGQMSEVALENAIKRLYDRKTNVFVSTTLIENGVDLPQANTLIVLDSDKLGLSQMYQLRGRVGRESIQAYAYFTYDKEKFLTEESMARLQSIAENTELGSGFKIAMRDLQIRGAGELLGKVQHGHMIKIGYDLYAKLLNDTLKKLKGEKVAIERDVKLDISITSKIPFSFIQDEAERLKVIAKISNISSKDQARSVLNELLAEYGKLPTEIHNLTNLALIKALAQKQCVKQISITKTKKSIVFYDDVDVMGLIKKTSKFGNFKFEQANLPTITLTSDNVSTQSALSYFIEFLST